MIGRPPPAISPLAPLPGPGLPLDGPWRMAQTDSQAGREPELAAPDFDDSGWQTVHLPRLQQATVKRDTLWYRRRLAASEAAGLRAQASDGGRLLLTFGGAFYAAQVWLNGETLGGHEGYFQPFAFDVTDRVRPGDNLLAVRCRFPVEAGAFRRKTTVAGIFADWDCKPYPSLLYPNLPPPNEWTVPVGLWRPAEVRRVGPVLIETCNVWPQMDSPVWPGRPAEPGAVGARLRIAGRLRNLTPEARTAGLSLSVEPHNFEGGAPLAHTGEIALEGGEAKSYEFELELPKPRLWFPWTHGEPWLYRARLALMGDPAGAAVEQTFGVRTIEAEYGPGRWEWRLNGRRIFPKGSNYIADFYLDRVRPEGLERDLDLARGANLDLLRVHAHIAPPEFYRLCDERGLMVMCDFPLIWTYAHDLPAKAEAEFRRSVAAQARDMVDLLASRPSIVLWSMHNEPPWTPDGSFLGEDIHQAQTNQSLDEASAELVRGLDPTRPVIPASGLYDQHLYHGWYQGGWPDNRRLEPPFPTEFGVQALPNAASAFWASVNTQWPVAADDPTWAHAGYQSIFWASPGVGPPAKFANLAEYILESQAYQAFYVRYTIEQWRRRKFEPTGGYIHFLLTDGWPAITWAVVDYYRQAKAGYAALAEASKPVRLCLDPGDNFLVEDGFRLVYPAGAQFDVRLYLVNDDYRQSGPVHVVWWLERRAQRGVAGWLSRLTARLRRRSVTLALPRADQGAVLAAAAQLPLRRPGEYSLRTLVSRLGAALDRNRLDFRVGQPKTAGGTARHVPGWLATKVYQAGSLRLTEDGFTFQLRNPAMPIDLERLDALLVDGAPMPLDRVEIILGGAARPATAISPHAPLHVPSGERLALVVHGRALEPGPHQLEIVVRAQGVGDLAARVRDRLA